MPRSEFHVDHYKGVFRVFKDYTLVEGNTWLRPQMQTSMNTLYFPNLHSLCCPLPYLQTPLPLRRALYFLPVCWTFNLCISSNSFGLYSTYADLQSSLHGTV